MPPADELTKDNRGSSPEARLRALFAQAAAGDAAAYRLFLDALSRHLRAYFRKRLARYPDEVEDLVQETLFAIHNQRHTYDAAQPLTPWAYAVARYKLVDFLRRHGRGDGLNDPLEDDGEFFAAPDSDAAEARRDLDKLLAALPDKQRLPIVQVKIEGLSVAETARLNGMSESAVKVAVHRGLKALAAKIRATP
ncbi:MAG: sigma-70 family RNA polymerase sigma factor [Rhodocyclaceae bacterium]